MIRQATIDDVTAICDLAERVWWPTYSPILSKEQIVYMLDMMYSHKSIHTQIAGDSYTYLLLYDDAALMGFASYSPRKENPGIYKLHRLYCDVTTKGKGYGKTLIKAVEGAVKAKASDLLELNVNIHNPAKAFYEHMGYAVVYSEQIDIGSGYIMDDYVMRKEL